MQSLILASQTHFFLFVWAKRKIWVWLARLAESNNAMVSIKSSWHSMLITGTWALCHRLPDMYMSYMPSALRHLQSLDLRYTIPYNHVNVCSYRVICMSSWYLADIPNTYMYFVAKYIYNINGMCHTNGLESCSTGLN